MFTPEISQARLKRCRKPDCTRDCTESLVILGGDLEFTPLPPKSSSQPCCQPSSQFHLIFTWSKHRTRSCSDSRPIKLLLHTRKSERILIHYQRDNEHPILLLSPHVRISDVKWLDIPIPNVHIPLKFRHQSSPSSYFSNQNIESLATEIHFIFASHLQIISLNQSTTWHHLHPTSRSPPQTQQSTSASSIPQPKSTASP
jgi:hypothetical protein